MQEETTHHTGVATLQGPEMLPAPVRRMLLQQLPGTVFKKGDQPSARVLEAWEEQGKVKVRVEILLPGVLPEALDELEHLTLEAMQTAPDQHLAPPGA